MADPEVEEVKEEIRKVEERLERKIKEREVSIFRALINIITDFTDFQSGKKKEFPKAAVIGLMHALFLPRAVFIMGGIGAALMGIGQLAIALKQNELIEAQSALLREQTEHGRREVLLDTLSPFAVDDDSRIAISLATLQGAKGKDIDALIEISKGNDAVSKAAIEALKLTADNHTPSQICDVANVLTKNFNTVFYQGFDGGVSEQSSLNNLSRLNIEQKSHLSVTLNDLIVYERKMAQMPKEKTTESLQCFLGFYQTVGELVGWHNFPINSSPNPEIDRLLSQMIRLDRSYSLMCAEISGVAPVKAPSDELPTFRPLQEYEMRLVSGGILPPRQETIGGILAARQLDDQFRAAQFASIAIDAYCLHPRNYPFSAASVHPKYPTHPSQSSHSPG